MTIENNGPYLAAALICEKVLQEKDEITSLIRVIDRVTITVPASQSSENLPPTNLSLSGFIALKSGDVKGRRIVKWRPETPSGSILPEQLLPVVFDGDDRGVNLNLTLNLTVNQEGVYWFSVLLEDQLLTRIPLRILYQRIGLGH